MIETIYLVVWLSAQKVMMEPSKTLKKVCDIKQTNPNAMVFRVDAFKDGRWETDAVMRAILVECQSKK